MPLNANLFGVWDLYAGPVHSELVLKPDGNYSHAFPGGSRGHWGTWDLQEIQDSAVLVLKLAGAEPMFEPGPNGPEPVAWPAVEQLAIGSVQPNVVSFYGAMMSRRFSMPSQQHFSTANNSNSQADNSRSLPTSSPSSSPVETPLATPTHHIGSADDLHKNLQAYIDDPSTPSGDTSNGSDAPAPNMVAGLNISSLGTYQQAPVAAPPAHSPEILNGWQSFMSSPPAYSQNPVAGPPFMPQQELTPPSADQLAQQNQEAIDSFNLQHQMNQAWLDAVQTNTLETALASHKIAQKWADYAGS